MNKSLTIRFKKEHFNEKNLRLYDARVISALSIPLPQYLEIIEQDENSYSGFYDGNLVAVAGVQKLWSKVGEAFMLATPFFETHPMYVARIIKRILHDKIILSQQFERIQTAVQVDFVKAHNFIKFLGFNQEGLMKKYINGEDYIRYSWVQQFQY